MLSPSVQAYAAKTPKSAALYERARQVFPSGVTHDTRFLKPYPLSIARAQGSRKWDVDGNEYVDYFGGHGALLLGHNHPAIVEAVEAQLARGTHYGASHELELEWAELITRLVPSAEKVRFTASGTEASLLGLRLVRAFTGKPKVLRFVSHFHGWHDQVAFGGAAGYDGALPAGITPETAEGSVLCDPNDITQVRSALETRSDIAAVLLEPTGASFGRVPTSGVFLRQLRDLTQARGVLLIFDEVITGFRCAPGGAQGHYGVTPDLTFLAKILAGGFPGGAVVGRADLMDVLTFTDDPKRNRDRRVPHQGTFNANPVSAAAGLAALRLVAETDATAAANRNGEQLRRALNDVIERQGVSWVVYGEFSGFHIYPAGLGRPSEGSCPSLEDIYAGKVPHSTLKGGTAPALMQDIRCGLIAEGVDVIPWPGGIVSAVHTGADIDRTAEGLSRLLDRLKSGVPST